MHPVIKLLLFGLLFNIARINPANAQTVDTAVARQLAAAKDTLGKPTIKNPAFRETDSAKLKDPRARIPRKAAIRSAVLPGWGQVYNKKIWKLPFVYGAIGGTGYYFFYNVKWYKDFRDGVRVVDALARSTSSPKDSSGYKGLDRVVRLTYENTGIETLRYYRDDFRRDAAYSAIYFLIAWGLNVIDATVDAHLSSFDISPDLAFKIQPGYSEMAGTAGMSFIVKIK
ncbi:DUF5683 domain-containing protein [Niabella aquatica]